MLGGNWKDYDKFDAIRGISGRWIDVERVAIHSPAGWWVLYVSPVTYRHNLKGKTAAGLPILGPKWNNAIDAIRQGNTFAPKFQRFQDLIASL